MGANHGKFKKEAKVPEDKVDENLDSSSQKTQLADEPSTTGPSDEQKVDDIVVGQDGGSLSKFELSGSEKSLPSESPTNEDDKCQEGVTVCQDLSGFLPNGERCPHVHVTKVDDLKSFVMYSEEFLEWRLEKLKKFQASSKTHKEAGEVGVVEELKSMALDSCQIISLKSKIWRENRQMLDSIVNQQGVGSEGIFGEIKTKMTDLSPEIKPNLDRPEEFYRGIVYKSVTPKTKIYFLDFESPPPENFKNLQKFQNLDKKRGQKMVKNRVLQAPQGPPKYHLKCPQVRHGKGRRQA